MPRPGSSVLITGASGGIGEALAYAFARDGYDVALAARSADRLAGVADRVRALGRRACTVALDLQAPDAGERLQADLEREGVRIDVLVNNAGYGQVGPFLDERLDEHLGAIDLNMRILTELTYRFLAPMKREGRGEGVINVASVAAFQPGPHMAVYYASKAYVLSFTEALNQELKGSPLHATALCPGPVSTGFQARASFDDSMRLMKLMKPRTAEVVARAALNGFRDRRSVVIPGLQEQIMARSAAFAPRALLLQVVEQLQMKRSGAHA